MEIIQGACSCGEVISIELNADRKRCSRNDRKRPFYPDENVEPFKVGNLTYTQEGVTTFTCRNCGGYIADTVPEAAWGSVDA